MNTSSIATWMRKVYQADLGIICKSTYSRVTEVEALRGGQSGSDAMSRRRDDAAAWLRGLVPLGEKFCSGPNCGANRPVGYFDKDNTTPDGLHYFCKTCRSLIGYSRWKADPDLLERKRKQDAEWKAKYFADPIKREEKREYERSWKQAQRETNSPYAERQRESDRRRKRLQRQMSVNR